jgi:hypothetical protein
MHVEWQGDHKLLGEHEQQDFERELQRLGLDPGKFLVEVRRESDQPGADARQTPRFTVYISDLAHPERDTLKLEGGPGENWIAQFAQAHRRR